MTTWYRLLTAFLLLAGVALPAHGDENPGDSSALGPVTRGFYFGATSSHYTNLMAPRFGLGMGVYANYPLTKLLGLQLELAYVSKGGQIEEAFGSSGELIQPAAKIRLGYLQFAVLTRLNQPRSIYRDEYNLLPKLLLGFGFAAKVSDSRWHDEERWAFKDTQLSLIFGGGFDHRVWGEKSFTFDFRFDLGLSSVYGDDTNKTALFLIGMTL